MTVSCSVVVCVMPPETPLMVMVDMPDTELAPAVSVNVLVELAEAGLNFAVTPVGRPAAVKATLALNPFVGTTVIVLVPGLPGEIVTEVGLAVRLKFGPAVHVLKMNDAMLVDQSKVS